MQLGRKNALHNMTARIKIYLIIFLVGIACLPSAVIAQGGNPVIAFVSDTQSPMLIEHVIRKLNHNEKATEMIFKDVVTVRPSCLFILGDVVSLGYKDAKWKKIDTYLKQCTDGGIPVYAVTGNHDLMGNADKGRRNFQARFAAHCFTGYTEVVDSVAVILLNSNFTKMSPGEIAKQDNWYANTLKEMNSDPAIKLVIVGCHHSPFTNSKAAKPSVAVQQKFVQEFIQSKKCVLFLSGHSHNFEQFNQQGKYFFVIGGGGGPHQPLYSGKKEVTHDLSGGYKPAFHYLEVRRSHDSLVLVSRQLNADFSGFKDGLGFTVGR